MNWKAYPGVNAFMCAVRRKTYGEVMSLTSRHIKGATEANPVATQQHSGPCFFVAPFFERPTSLCRQFFRRPLCRIRLQFSKNVILESKSENISFNYGPITVETFPLGIEIKLVTGISTACI